MSGQGRFDRLLRWYPTAWRQRYGDELVALMEDTYGDRPVPLRSRLSLVRTGGFERLRETGLVGVGNDPAERVRAGSLLVLCAWAVFVVAGAGFAKFAEHWEAVTPTGARWLPSDAFGIVQWGATTGAVIVVLAAALTVPAFIRSTHQGGWAAIRRPVLRAMVVTSATALVSVGIVLWAHHLGPRQRNGGLGLYQVAGLVWVLMLLASIASCAAAAVAATRRLQLPTRVLRGLGALALAMTLAMVAIIGGTLVWWGAIATNAPWFLGNSVGGSGAATVPPAMVVAGLLMLFGLVVALCGAGRVVRSVARVSPPA